ncbi:MAG: type II toxin-antitoxin system HicA family toxin [Candidatus Eremiobacterota bacterium]
MTARELCRRFERAGWTHVRTVGSHRRYQKTTRKGRTYGFPVPMHPGDLPGRIVHNAERVVEQARKEDEEG